MTLILAGDVGGTKCNLGLFLKQGHALRSVFKRRLATRNYAGFEDLIGDFLQQAVVLDEIAMGQAIDAAGFGLAGVVIDGCLHAENLRWALDVGALTKKLNLKNIVLLNDVAATALSLERLSPGDLVLLNQGSPEQYATRAVIAAGTGLGEAILFWDGRQYRVERSEGGQGDFAPRTEREIQLLNHLKSQLPHVSCEEIVSGRGFAGFMNSWIPRCITNRLRLRRAIQRVKSHKAGWLNPASFAWRPWRSGRKYMARWLGTLLCKLWLLEASTSQAASP